MLKTIKTSTVQDSVYNELFQAIIKGKIVPGERITLDGLAKQMGVSIMPVREAIRRLEAANFITVKNRRVVVNELSEKNAREILETRILLEGYAAEKAAIRMSPKTLEKLEDLLNIMQQSKELEPYLKANREFHATIYREAANLAMLDIINSLWEKYSPYLHLLSDKAWWKLPKFVATHRKIFEGMKQKNPKTVRKWLKTDLTQGLESIIPMLRQNP